MDVSLSYQLSVETVSKQPISKKTSGVKPFVDTRSPLTKVGVS